MEIYSPFMEFFPFLPFFGENRMGGFRKGGFSNNRFVLKSDVAIASEVSILSTNSLAITYFHAKKAQHVQLFENPLPGNPPIRDSQLFTLSGDLRARGAPRKTQKTEGTGLLCHDCRERL